MSDLTKRIQVAKVRAAEGEAIDGIPRDLKALLDAAQRRHEEEGGCPGCGSMVLAVHVGDCPELKDVEEGR